MTLFEILAFFFWMMKIVTSHLVMHLTNLILLLWRQQQGVVKVRLSSWGGGLSLKVYSKMCIWNAKTDINMSRIFKFLKNWCKNMPNFINLIKEILKLNHYRKLCEIFSKFYLKFVALLYKWVLFFMKIWYERFTFKVSGAHSQPNYTWVGPPPFWLFNNLQLHATCWFVGDILLTIIII